MPWIDHRVNCRRWLPRHIGASVLTLALPSRCPLCGKAGAGNGYCPVCSAELSRHGEQCRVCAVPLVGRPICGRCQQDPPPIDETVAPFRYAPPVSNAIHRLKYHGKLAHGRDLGFLLAGEIENRNARLPDILVPVPLHWKRRFRRGFNQSLEIALPLSRELGIPVEPGLARRRVHTRPQVGQAPRRRRGNVRGVFEASGRAPRSIAIVDDVVTSGSTVTELARCLTSAGAREIYVWALTRV